MADFMVCLDEHSGDAIKVAKLVLGYSQLEIQLMNAVIISQRHEDFGRVLDAMFGIRGEKPRVVKAAELGCFADIGEIERFKIAIAAMHCCREKRNQLAHANWWSDESDGRTHLTFITIEGAVRQRPAKEHFSDLPHHRASDALVDEWLKFFGHTEAMFEWLNKKAGIFHQLKGYHPDNIGEWPENMPVPERVDDFCKAWADLYGSAAR